jgi:glycosyltransferase involved in cell wall biosynthesis
MPSNWEGLPIVAIEAAFMKRPLVATQIAGMSEIVIDGETGLLVERGDAEGLAEAIAYLIDNPDQAEAMGQAAAAFVEKNFTLERFGRQHDELYQQVAEMV